MAEQFFLFESGTKGDQRHAQEGRTADGSGIDPLKLLPPALLPELPGGKNQPEKKDSPPAPPAGIGDAPWLPQLGPPASDDKQQPEGQARRGFFGGGNRKKALSPEAPPLRPGPAVPDAAQAKDTGRIAIPTLHLGKPADERDRTSYERSSLAAKIFIEHKDSIVQIFGKGEKVGKDGQKAPFADAGSGFFVTDEGRIVTAYHVVRDTDSLTVKTAQGKTYNAVVEKVQPDSDLALIRLVDRQPHERFKALAVGTASPKEGDPVFAIGHPQGWNEEYLSAGKFLFSSYNYNLDLSKLALTRQVVDSSKLHVEPGNSGGPLIDKNGDAVGVLSRINYSSGARVESIGILNINELLSKNQADAPSEKLPFPSAAHLLAHDANLYFRSRMLQSPRSGWAGSAFSIGLGAFDLATRDVANFRDAVSNGGAKEIIGCSLHLGADALLIGGGIAGISSKYKVAGAIAAMAGSGFKIGADVLQGARATYRAFSG